MKTTTIALAALLLALASGCCWMGEHHGAYSNVLVTFLPASGRSVVPVSRGSPEVQDALKVIDAVLIPEGLTREDPTLRSSSGAGYVANYLPPRYSMIGYCCVTVGGNDLNIAFWDRSPGGRTQQVRRLCKSIAHALRSHFGDDRVRVKLQWL
jgi:hypothetical protein